jgi:hypothetical protein
MGVDYLRAVNPRFPIYIPSKGRAKNFLTPRVLIRMGVPFRVVVEEMEYDAYASRLPEENLLILDPMYKRTYDLLDEHGLEKSTGSGPARNFIWDHSIQEGHDFHWIMDDNIWYFWRLHQNKKIRMADGTFFHMMETFVLRYENVAMAGPQYETFVPYRTKRPPFVPGSRIYSCNLIRNDVPFRWRGRYNEDTILSLDMLKGGWQTILFYAFLQEKRTTQTMKGGNLDELYSKNGTLPKSEMLVRAHPDVAKLSWKFNRAHHHVDYSKFRKMPLIKREGWSIDDEPKYDLRLAPKTI